MADLLQATGPRAEDLALCWTALAAAGGQTVAAAVIGTKLLRVATYEQKRKAAPLLRLAGEYLGSGYWGLENQVGRENLRDELAKAGIAAFRDEIETPPEGTPVEGPSLVVVRGEIPKGNRSRDSFDPKPWEVLTKPLPLASGIDPDILATVLDAEFPWFAAVIEAIVGDLRLRRSVGLDWVHWRPLLMVGPPGTGKTRFARRLGQLSGIALGEINAGGSTDNRLLQGTARGWGTANPALPLHLIHQHRQANPIMFVDEIDKAGGNERNGRVQQTLLGLLEPLSAKNWMDECLMVACDLSAINWLLAANDAAPLRGPLLTRLRVVEVPLPAPEHAEAILAAGETERTLNDVIRPRPITWRAPETNEDREGSGSGSSGGWLGRQPTNDTPDEAGARQPTQQAAAAAIPFVVHRVAEFFGMTLMAAWTWWQSLSEGQKQSIIRRMDGSAGGGQPDGAKEDCEHLYNNVDIPTCNAISRKRGKEAAARCFQSASARYSACRAGKPKDQWPPLDTWNN